MNTKTTWFLAGSALLVFFYILVFERKASPTNNEGPAPFLLKEFDPSQAQALEVSISTNRDVIRVVKTNGAWQLVKPVYPAQSTPIDTLISHLAELRQYDLIQGPEAAAQGLKNFGLDPPRAVVTLQVPSQQISLAIGARTPLTNQLYVQVKGTPAVAVTDATILNLIPTTSVGWRNPMLLQLDNTPFDAVLIRSGNRVVEIEKEATNQAWRITKPIPARADQTKVSLLLQTLKNARVNGFVADPPAFDLEQFGLQTPELELSFLAGTNKVGSFLFGKSPTNDPTHVFVERLASSNIVLADRRLAEMLQQPYKAFHDPHLLSLEFTNINRVTVKANEQFTLQHLSTGWQIVEPRAVDADPLLMQEFLTNLANLEILDFAREVPTDTDLKALGFTPPLAVYSFYRSTTNSLGLTTNMLVTALEFGTNKVDVSYVRRTDETPIYMTPFADFLMLPNVALKLRDRHIWSFGGTNVLGLTISYKGVTNSLARIPALVWSADPLINAPVEETLHRVGSAQAVAWTSRGEQRLRLYGINENSLTLSLEVNHSGKIEKYYIAFGSRSPSGNYYATVPLPGEGKVIFEFPGGIYEDIVRNLPAPPDAVQTLPKK